MWIRRIQPTPGSTMMTPNATGSARTEGASAARTAVGEAMAARRSRPPLAVPLSAALTRPLDKKRTSGLAVALFGWAASAAVYFSIQGPLGWVLGGVGAVVTLAGASGDVLSFPHQVRAARRRSRLTRITQQFTKACEGSQAGAQDAGRTSTFRFTIVNGSIFSAALAVCMLYREIAGDAALADDISQQRSPVWPAWCYRVAKTAELEGDEQAVVRYLEQTFATAHPVWATAAGIGLLDRLDETRDAEQVSMLTDWIQRWGDSSLATELLFFDR